jgi:hypothetical protein
MITATRFGSRPVAAAQREIEASQYCTSGVKTGESRDEPGAAVCMGRGALGVGVVEAKNASKKPTRRTTRGGIKKPDKQPLPCDS